MDLTTAAGICKHLASQPCEGGPCSGHPEYDICPPCAARLVVSLGNSPLRPCPNCNAMTTCCAASKDRGATASSLARVVAQQSKSITDLIRDVSEARRRAVDSDRKLAEYKAAYGPL